MNLDSFALDIILPIGISFYTFQTLSYVIDVYRGNYKAERHLGYYALFVCYFPQLVAGPIERPDDDFFDYLNDFNTYAVKKWATCYYGFAPVNAMGIADGTTAEDIENYYTKLKAKLNFNVLGNPINYVYDYEWFYDNNFHMNSAGMYVYTDRIAEDIKAEMGITSPNKIAIPQKPEPAPLNPAEGDDSDADCFTYEQFEGGLRIIGFTEAGIGKSSYVIPANVNGQRVICFSVDTFKGNTTVNEIIIQSNIGVLYDGNFEGCTRLTRLILQQKTPNAIGVGANLLYGAGNCRIYVPDDVYDIFATHYNWGAYREVIIKLN